MLLLRLCDVGTTTASGSAHRPDHLQYCFLTGKWLDFFLVRSFVRSLHLLSGKATFAQFPPHAYFFHSKPGLGITFQADRTHSTFMIFSTRTDPQGRVSFPGGGGCSASPEKRRNYFCEYIDVYTVVHVFGKFPGTRHDKSRSQPTLTCGHCCLAATAVHLLQFAPFASLLLD